MVAGGGACELRLAAHLKELAAQTPGLEQYSIRKYAETLETIPRTLAENAGQVGCLYAFWSVASRLRPFVRPLLASC